MPGACSRFRVRGLLGAVSTKNQEVVLDSRDCTVLQFKTGLAQRLGIGLSLRFAVKFYSLDRSWAAILDNFQEGDDPGSLIASVLRSVGLYNPHGYSESGSHRNTLIPGAGNQHLVGCHFAFSEQRIIKSHQHQIALAFLALDSPSLRRHQHQLL